MKINISKIKCTNLLKLKHMLNMVDQNTLVIFDIDDVLITPINNHDFWHPNEEQLIQKIKRQRSNPPETIIDSISIYTTEYRLVDPEIINIFTHLRTHHLTTIALTAMGSGLFGVINSLEDLRIETLKNIGLDFTMLNTFNEQISPEELKGLTNIFPIWIGSPMLKNGIIFTAGIDKGAALEYILCKKSYHPKNIIFVDDNISNIESLEKLCIKSQINFYGFHYIAVSLTQIPISKNKQDESSKKLSLNIY